MDLAAARAALYSMTRAAFGELVSIYPYKKGPMSITPDPDLPPLLDIPAKFDLAGDIEQLGGGRERPDAAMGMGDVATVSIERRHLPWVPQSGYRLTRVDRITGETETYRISRLGASTPNLTLIYLSKV